MSRNFFENCTEVSELCPVSATTYGYIPNLGGNIVLLVVFGILGLAHIPLVIRYRLWTYSFAVGAGCLMEAIGYIGRVLMHDNVWDDNAFTMQVTCLIIAPSFIAAGIYLTVKHLMIYYGPEHSILKPRLYTWIFIGCDIFSIVLQAIGGGIASGADGDRDQAESGNNLMIAGVAFQVVTMALCGLLALLYTFRYSRAKKAAGITREQGLKRPQIFVITSMFAYVFVLIRCIYRLPEMAGGWGGELMRHEAEFMILDGLMIALGSILLTVSYPGFMVEGIMKVPKTASRSGVSSPEAEKEDA